MNWWMEKPYRMVQNNLRDIDGAMDVDYEVDMLKKLGANVVQVGCGGISAYGPSQLACQRSGKVDTVMPPPQLVAKVPSKNLSCVSSLFCAMEGLLIIIVLMQAAT